MHAEQRLSTPMVSPSVSKEAVVGPREEAVKMYMVSADESSGTVGTCASAAGMVGARRASVVDVRGTQMVGAG